MEYEFYYSKKNGKCLILGNYYNNDDDSIVSFEIQSLNNLIDFIKENIRGYADVYFDGFDKNDVEIIIDSISDVIDIIPDYDDSHYELFGKNIRQRSKANGMDKRAGRSY